MIAGVLGKRTYCNILFHYLDPKFDQEGLKPVKLDVLFRSIPSTTLGSYLERTVEPSTANVFFTFVREYFDRWNISFLSVQSLCSTWYSIAIWTRWVRRMIIVW
jgi:hypothetical protein